MALDSVFKFGDNTDIEAGSVPEDVWLEGGAYPFPAVARQLTVYSSSADDDGDPAGSGAQAVEAVYLDAAFGEITVTATLNGVGTVNVGTVAAYRLNQAFTTTSTGGGNAGTIYFAIGGTIIGRIDPNQGEAAQAIYTVPSQYEYAELNQYFSNVGRSASAAYAQIEFQFKPDGESWRTRFIDNLQTTGTSDNDRNFEMGKGPRFTAGTDLRVRVTDVSATVFVGAGFDLLQKPKTTIVTGA